ncbi:DUF535 family protein [Novosphingobium terrae]|uniref:DUF535 family protein n=1 Tax=Novosphingobium terrae TaxID=2726189 RepID=UPI00197FBC9C|nr:DUF535 family protein [Novosphingobium terrae]
MALALMKKKYAKAFASKEDGRLKVVARLYRFSSFITNPDRHWRVRRAISWDGFKIIKRLQPRIEFKYLHPKYLVKGLDTDSKASIFIRHYEVLSDALSDKLSGLMLSEGLDLWSYGEEAENHSIKLVFSHPTDNEGELTLEYMFGSSLIYLMSFSFAPGSLVGRPEETIILLTRIQGIAKEFEAARCAMKDLRGLSAASLLMAALQGIALGIEARTILSVCAEAQVCLTDAESSVFLNAYDKYLSDLGAEKYSDKFFLLNIPLVERPLEEVKSSNRSRVRFQRERKRDLLTSSQNLFLQSRAQSSSPYPSGDAPMTKIAPGGVHDRQ